jgi:hypothetical protein
LITLIGAPAAYAAILLVVPDRDIVAAEALETAKRPQRIAVIVQDGDFHDRAAIGLI